MHACLGTQAQSYTCWLTLWFTSLASCVGSHARKLLLHWLCCSATIQDQQLVSCEFLVCLPLDQTASLPQCISSLPTCLKSFWCPTLQLPCCLWLLGEMQTLHLRWRDAGFWFKKGFFLLSAVPALPCRANSSSAPLAHSSVSREVAGSASQPDCWAPSWLRVCLALPRDTFELFQPNRAQR